MRNSVAKGVVREALYRECFGEWLDPLERQLGNALILMGGEAHEVPLLDDIGFARHHVHSVERDAGVWARQHDMLRRGVLGVGLYFGELSDYARIMLHQQTGFVALNLDVEGGYRTQLDSAMTDIVRLCIANPRTVVAMHSTVGRRDMYTIYEGVRGLYLLFLLAPTCVSRMMGSLVDRYRQIGCTEPVRFALRDVFWISSQIEHILCASVFSGWLRDTLYESVQDMFADLYGSSRVRQRAVRLSRIEDDVATWCSTHRRELDCLEAVRIPLQVGRLVHFYYLAQRPWSQRCFVVRYDISFDSWKSIGEVASMLCVMVTASPMEFVDRAGVRRSISGRRLSEDERDMDLISGQAFLSEYYHSFRPRQVRARASSRGLRL